MSKKIIYYGLFLISCFINGRLHAHEGHNHNEVEAINQISGLKIETTEKVSEKYEVLLKYQFKEKNIADVFLYLSDRTTNVPIDGEINIHFSHLKKVVVPQKKETGIYKFTLVVPDSNYKMGIEIDGSLGKDRLGIEGINYREISKEKINIPSWIWMLIGFILGAGGIWFIFKLGRKSKALILSGLTWTFHIVPLEMKAHEDHGEHHETDDISKSEIFYVPKEIQFKLGIKTGKGFEKNELNRSKNYGMVIPDVNGKQVINALFDVEIKSIMVKPGTQVSKGQTLMVVEKLGDFAQENEYNLELNRHREELKLAIKNLNRIKLLGAAASKQELEEAESRKNIWEQNLRVLEDKGGKKMVISAAISGEVGMFQLAQGSVVNSGNPLIAIINNNEVLIEWIISTGEEKKVKVGDHYGIIKGEEVYQAKVLRILPEISENLQGIKVHLKLNNKNLRIGEMVSITQLENLDKENNEVKPLEWDYETEIFGKTVAFIKKSAEYFQVIYNPELVKEREGVVHRGAYYLKMVYLKQ